MPEEDIELLIREFGEWGTAADEQEVGIGLEIRKFDQSAASAHKPEADIGPLSHEFGDGGTSADIGPLDHEFGESGDSSPDKNIRPLFADWGPPAAARKFDELELDIGPLSHEFGESGDSVRQTETEVAIGQGECVETTDKPELDTKTVIPWTTNWWVPADKLKVIPRDTNWWPVPVPVPEVDEETVGATNDMIPEPVIYGIHNSGTYWTQVNGVIGDPPAQVPKTSVIRTVFYFKMDPPLPLGAQWGYGRGDYDCGTCFDELSDHMTDSCPFMALATQFNETKSTGMSPAKKTSSLKPLGGKKKGTEKSSRFEAYFPPVLSPAERTAANLMTRRKMNLIRICNYLNFSKVGEIKKLFKKLGRVIHAYIPIPGGNGFVNFVRRVDALTAIKKMDGYEFEGLKLRVVWAYFDASRVDV